MKPVQPVIEEQEGGGKRNLDHQLRRRLQRQHIVDEARAKHHRRSGDEERRLTRDVKHERAHEQARRDAHAAEQGHRPAVPAIFTRAQLRSGIDGRHLEIEPAQHRRERIDARADVQNGSARRQRPTQQPQHHRILPDSWKMIRIKTDRVPGAREQRDELGS